MVGTFDVLGSHGMVCRGWKGEEDGDACLPIHFRALTVGRHLMVSQLRILDMSVILLVSEPGFRLRISI